MLLQFNYVHSFNHTCFSFIRMPSSSLFLSVGSIFLSSLFARVSATTYTLQDSYSGLNFFDGFNFNSNKDLANGYVKWAFLRLSHSGTCY